MGRVTLKTIAEHTGLSKFAVSRALSGKSGVSEETRRKVNEAAARFGYRKPAKSGMRTVGVVFDDSDIINSELYMRMQNGIRRESHKLGLKVSMHWTHSPAELERFAHQNDGLLVVGTQDPEGLDLAYATGTPIVRSPWLAPLEQVDAVLATDREAGAAVAEYLVDLGHREIVYVHGTPGYRGRLERFLGIGETAQRRTSLKVHNLTWEEDSSFAQALADLHKQGHRPTTFFCSHDGLAVTVLSELLTQGYNIPGDVSVVGFGDFLTAQQILPQLTTVRLRGSDMGAAMVRLLDDRISGRIPADVPVRVQIPCEIIERDSVGKVSKKPRQINAVKAS